MGMPAPEYAKDIPDCASAPAIPPGPGPRDLLEGHIRFFFPPEVEFMEKLSESLLGAERNPDEGMDVDLLSIAELEPPEVDWVNVLAVLDRLTLPASLEAMEPRRL